jgi:hypothetical protein
LLLAAACTTACDEAASRAIRDSGNLRASEPAPPSVSHPDRHTAADTMPTHSPDLEWTIAVADGGASYRVHYVVRNATADTIHLLDRLLVQRSGHFSAVDDQFIILSGDTPTEARVVRGFTRARRDRSGSVAIQYPPAARAIPPGGSAEGEGNVPRPLVPWHNFETPPALSSSPTHVRLEIGYLRNYARWGEVPLADGSRVLLAQPPHVPAQEWLRSEAAPLPEQ